MSARRVNNKVRLPHSLWSFAMTIYLSLRDVYTLSLRDVFTLSLRDDFALSLRDVYTLSLRDVYTLSLRACRGLIHQTHMQDIIARCLYIVIASEAWQSQKKNSR